MEGPLFSFLLGLSLWTEAGSGRASDGWRGHRVSVKCLRNVVGPGARNVRLRPMVPKSSRCGVRWWEGGDGRDRWGWAGVPGLRACGGSPTCRCPRTGSPLSSSTRLPPLGLGWRVTGRGET